MEEGGRKFFPEKTGLEISAQLYWFSLDYLRAACIIALHNYSSLSCVFTSTACHK